MTAPHPALAWLGWFDPVFYLVLAAIVAVCVWILARYLRRLVVATMGRRRIRPEVGVLVSRIVFIAVVVVGLFTVLAVALKDGNLALGGVLIATIVASLGVQDILRNYVSGLYLLTERHLQAGDEIEFEGRIGTVAEVRLRVTYLRGRGGELVIIPNAELFNKIIVSRPQAPGEMVPTPSEAEGGETAAAIALSEASKSPR